MTLIILLITVAYLALIGSFIIGFDKVKPFYLDERTAKTSFSIIIPFKNEAEHLKALLTSLSELKYPEKLFEVILVNDDSTDDSEAIINKFKSKNSGNYRVIKNERKTGSPKKDAITKAISIARNEWILTTDADCTVPKYWLESFDGFIQNMDSYFISGPVNYHRANTFLEQFQTLEKN